MTEADKNIIDLFADSANVAPGTREKKDTPKGTSKSSSFKSEAMMQAMGLISNPKKLKGIIAVLVVLLIIGIGSTVAFFVIYPVCIIWALGAFIVIAGVNKMCRYKKTHKDAESKWNG